MWQISAVAPVFPALAVALLAVGLGSGAAQTNPMTQSAQALEKATLGGGCFWCTEALFQMLPGVKSVRPGYAGGTRDDPTYEEVCTGLTGHAEVIQLEFAPALISYETLLATFWKAHDPTTWNSQGPDVGTQYRSIILYSSPAQKAQAEQSKTEHQKLFTSPIVTEIVPLKRFWPAEAYHQDYYRSHPNQSYCRAVILPKIEKFEKKLHGK